MLWLDASRLWLRLGHAYGCTADKHLGAYCVSDITLAFSFLRGPLTCSPASCAARRLVFVSPLPLALPCHHCPHSTAVSVPRLVIPACLRPVSVAPPLLRVCPSSSSPSRFCFSLCLFSLLTPLPLAHVFLRAAFLFLYCPLAPIDLPFTLNAYPPHSSR